MIPAEPDGPPYRLRRFRWNVSYEAAGPDSSCPSRYHQPDRLPEPFEEHSSRGKQVNPEERGRGPPGRFGNGTNRARLRLSPYMMQTRFWFRKGKRENPVWRIFRPARGLAA